MCFKKIGKFATLGVLGAGGLPTMVAGALGATLLGKKKRKGEAAMVAPDESWRGRLPDERRSLIR